MHSQLGKAPYKGTRSLKVVPARLGLCVTVLPPVSPLELYQCSLYHLGEPRYACLNCNKCCLMLNLVCLGNLKPARILLRHRALQVLAADAVPATTSAVAPLSLGISATPARHMYASAACSMLLQLPPSLRSTNAPPWIATHHRPGSSRYPFLPYIAYHIPVVAIISPPSSLLDALLLV